MRRFLDDDSLIDSGNELRLTTVAGGSAEEDEQASTSKVHYSVCSHKHQNYIKQEIYWPVEYR
jgi:hypothetical protein